MKNMTIDAVLGRSAWSSGRLRGRKSVLVHKDERHSSGPPGRGRPWARPSGIFHHPSRCCFMVAFFYINKYVVHVPFVGLCFVCLYVCVCIVFHFQGFEVWTFVWLGLCYALAYKLFEILRECVFYVVHGLCLQRKCGVAVALLYLFVNSMIWFNLLVVHVGAQGNASHCICASSQSHV